MHFIWRGEVVKASYLLDMSGKRQMFWYGVTIGQVGFGVLVSEKRPTKYAPDVASAASAEPDSGLKSIPAVESDTQPRG